MQISVPTSAVALLSNPRLSACICGQIAAPCPPCLSGESKRRAGTPRNFPPPKPHFSRQILKFRLENFPLHFFKHIKRSARHRSRNVPGNPSRLTIKQPTISLTRPCP
jgi:hypothetical protein